ncbi:MAG: hypothetical protein NXI24_19605 [bacterium]|nr:hypothetical protein [bacterium]
MKLRAIHLLNRMERIERDLSEISTLRSTLQDDREYTSRLRTSLQDETVRMRELQAKILTQVIQNPPEALARIAAADSAAPRPVAVARPALAPEGDAENMLRPPEIIIPAGGGKSKGDSKGDSKSQASGGSRPARDNAKPSASGRPAKNKRGSEAAKNEGGDQTSDESFNFTFVQK